MSIFVASKVWNFSRAKVSSTLLVLLAIADFADDEGNAYPAVNTLANKVRISPRSVQRAIQELVALGELQVLPQAGMRGCNLYRVTVESSASKPAASAAQGGDSSVRGDKLTGVTPVTRGGDTGDAGGCHPRREGVTPVSPEPSLTVREPSENRQAKFGRVELRSVRNELRLEAPSKRESFPELPAGSSAALRAVWEQWLQHRRELKNPLTPTAARLQIAQIFRWPEAEAIADIERSIQAGWKGILGARQARRPFPPAGNRIPDPRFENIF